MASEISRIGIVFGEKTDRPEVAHTKLNDPPRSTRHIVFIVLSARTIHTHTQQSLGRRRAQIYLRIIIIQGKMPEKKNWLPDNNNNNNTSYYEIPPKHCDVYRRSTRSRLKQCVQTTTGKRRQNTAQKYRAIARDEHNNNIYYIVLTSCQRYHSITQ